MVNTTLFNILHSELINLGHNELFNSNQITAFDDEFTFMKKVLKYDKDIEKIVTERFFLGLSLDNNEHDRKFKRHFINRFLHYQPAHQTMEIFGSSVSYVFLNNIDFLNEYYENIDDYMRGKNSSNRLGDEKRLSDNRHARATLPQTEINIDVDNTVLDYADSNDINRARDITERENNDTSFSMNIDNLEKARGLLRLVMEEFEATCFLKVW